MIIEADEEGKHTIQELCNLALLAGGLKAFNYVSTALAAMNRPKIKPVDKPKKKAGDK